MDGASATDLQIQTFIENGDFAAAATLALRAHGPELLGFLHAVAPAGVHGDELFSALCERIWCGLPTFASKCGFRSWAYRVARNLVTDTYRRQRLPTRRCLDVDEVSAIDRLAHQVRSTTPVHLRDATKARLHAIRAALGIEDRTLLILRVDRQMTWHEVADVLGPGDDLERASRRLRKRFERIKDKLRSELANE